ncbi:MAG: hypothetical protein KJZ93_09300 [Caldilineaceae bacterium]|nr:hypothetical protein [Caldilineaceae bacterium]
MLSTDPDGALVVPTAFAAATVKRAGEAGRRWIAELPEMVGGLCRHWNLEVDGPSMHGYLGLVIPVRRKDEACVLKVSLGDESSAEEALALAAWDGRGAVRLLAEEPTLGALLLERLDHRRSLGDLAIGEALTIAGRLLRRLAIPAPPGFATLREVGPALSATLTANWEAYGRPMPRRTLARAMDAARDLGATAGGLLVNYDLHDANVLAGGREPWLAVDPKVVVGDPEYGIAQLLWRRLEEIEEAGGLEPHFQLLVEAAALDAERARAWTLVRCVDYWLWGLSVGFTEDPARCDAIVRWLA